MLDPNPDEMNADPQPCLKLLLLLWWWLSLELLLGRRLTPMALVTRHRHQHYRENTVIRINIFSIFTLKIRKKKL
jgi:hypothetical protein